MNKILFTGILALVLVSGFILYNNCQNDDSPDTAEAPSGPATTESGIMVSGPTINNDLWGRVTEIEYTGDYVVLQAFPVNGYQFNYWTNMDGTLISSDVGDYSSTTLRVPIDEDRPYIAVFGQAGTVSREYRWTPPTFNQNGTVSYNGEAEVFNISISTAGYQASINDPGIQRQGTVLTNVPVSLCADDQFIQACADHLAEYTEGMTNMKKAITILTFIQDVIGYELDSNQYDKAEFWATPMETLYSGMGDCEDTALMFVSIAKLMDVDCGFVTFNHDVDNTPDSGHMSIAVALTENERISGGNTFVYKGTTYAYGETAFDPTGEYNNYHPTIGELGNNYSLRDGIFTYVSYSEEEGFKAASPIAISGVGGSESGSIVYGSNTDYSNPPTVEMNKGDSFSYSPQTNLPAVFTAEGSGMAFLVYDGETNTLKGTADRTGYFSVIITVTTTEGPLQTAVQTLTFHVSESVDQISDNQLIYGANGWEVKKNTTPVYEENQEEPVDDDKKDDSKDKILLGILVVLIVGMTFLALIRRGI